MDTDTRQQSTTESEAPQPDRLDLAIAVAMTAGGAAVTTYIARRWWFHADAWDFLTNRSLSDPLTLLEPHAGHWQTPAVLLYRVLQATAGMDFYPWYLLPRSIGYALLALWLWRVLVRRGTARHVALATLGVVLVFGAANWHDASTIGNLIVVAAAYRIALLFAATHTPADRDRWLLFGLLVLALMSSSLGVAVLGGTLVAAALSAWRRRWTAPVLGAMAVYGVWYAVFRLGNSTSPPVAPTELVRLPEVFVRIFGNAIRILIDAPMNVGIGLAALATIALVWLAFRKRLDGFDTVLLVTAVVFVSMVLLVRLANGSAQITAARYAYNVALMVLPVAIPHLAPRAAGRWTWLVAAALVVSIPGNFAFLGRGIDFWERRAQASSEVVTAAAVLIAAGEPALPTSAVDPPRAGVLTVAGVQRLVDGGWSPETSADADALALARANLRFDLRPDATLVGAPARTLSTVDENGCSEVAAPDQLTAVVDESGSVTLEASRDADVVITWVDEFGTGRRNVTLAGGVHTLWLAAPATTAELRLMVEAGSMRVCGLLGLGT